jgi:anaerobic ribonucleoside-triphosphate reductase
MTAEEIRIASLPGMPLISDGDVNKVVDNLKRILKVQKDAQALSHQIGQEV